jgi:hypothetical protein
LQGRQIDLLLSQRRNSGREPLELFLDGVHNGGALRIRAQKQKNFVEMNERIYIAKVFTRELRDQELQPARGAGSKLSF